MEYFKCTYADSPTPWCATEVTKTHKKFKAKVQCILKVDSSSNVFTNKWGDCDDSSTTSCETETISITACTTAAGQCIFPFRYKVNLWNSQSFHESICQKERMVDDIVLGCCL